MAGNDLLDLNANVHTRVFGNGPGCRCKSLLVPTSPPYTHCDYCRLEIPLPYSLTPSAAWLVVERLQEQGWYAEICTRPTGVTVCFERAPSEYSGGVWKTYGATDERFPVAVCQAALKLVDAEPDWNTECVIVEVPSE